MVCKLPLPPSLHTLILRILVSGSLDVNAFADRLWGDIWFNERKFTRKQADAESNRTFVTFVLEPLYKLYSQVLSEDTKTLQETLETLGIKLKPEDLAKFTPADENQEVLELMAEVRAYFDIASKVRLLLRPWFCSWTLTTHLRTALAACRRPRDVRDRPALLVRVLCGAPPSAV